MKMKAKKRPTEPGYYLINTDDNGLDRPLIIYCDDGKYTYGRPEEISDSENAIPIEKLTDYGFWRFFGPINLVGLTA